MIAEPKGKRNRVDAQSQPDAFGAVHQVQPPPHKPCWLPPLHVPAYNPMLWHEVICVTGAPFLARAGKMHTLNYGA